MTSSVTAIATGGNHTCALTSGGGVKCWGSNLSGQLGDDSYTPRNQPVDVVAADHYAVVEGGKIYQILNLPVPDKGQVDVLNVSEFDQYFKPRSFRGLSSGKSYTSPRVYKHVTVYRKPFR